MVRERRAVVIGIKMWQNIQGVEPLPPDESDIDVRLIPPTPKRQKIFEVEIELCGPRPALIHGDM